MPRPLGGHVGEAGHSHAMRQPPGDGRFREIGRQEGKRDRHVDLANAAPLALGNAFRICVRVGKKFIKVAEYLIEHGKIDGVAVEPLFPV